ncbi:serine/threonine protein kinase [Paraglaciecola marina]|uniref:serine/threonine protein kinase n=1 Tax=Paraglaciecola marina TaxID=2500157 RepID=UPI00105C3A17|nr:serine/threonine protein kinase [Paraglaciecola marina]
MKLNNTFKVSTLVLAMALAGCGGGDIVLDASDNSTYTDNSDNSVTGDTGSGDTNVCATYTDESGVAQQGTEEGDNCRYTSQFVSSSNPILTNITFSALENGGAHIFNESLYIGQNYSSLSEAATAGINSGGDGASLFIEAGATLAFQSGTAVVINRGSQIRAEGTSDAPITFTSETDIDGNITPEETGAWGGMVINGFGFTNGCEYESGWAFEPNSALDEGSALELVTDADCSIAVEGLIGNDETTYGGELPEDNSGELSYVVVKHAGSALSPGNELNGITFGAVGSETTVSNLEIYSNIDDGIEFFGGGVNVENYVAVYVQDDSIDIDDGYYGTITNALVIQGGGIDAAIGTRTGAHCVESDGASTRDEDTVFDEDYLSRATITNLTCISSAKNEDTAGNGDPGAGINFEEGHLLTVTNSIITTAYAGDDEAENNNYCFQAEDDIDAIQVAAGLLTFSENIFACPDMVADDLDLGTVDTSSEQYTTAVSRRADGAAGPFSGTVDAFLDDTGNLTSEVTVRADEGVTTNILSGFYTVTQADMLVDGTAVSFAAGSTFTADDLSWTYGLIDGARGQDLWFEDGQTPGDR